MSQEFDILTVSEAELEFKSGTWGTEGASTCWSGWLCDAECQRVCVFVCSYVVNYNKDPHSACLCGLPLYHVGASYT